MSNGELIAEIQRLLESDDTIPQNVTNSILLVALRQIYQEGKSRADTLTVLNQRVILMEEWIKNQVWFQRLLISVILAEAIGLIYHFITP